MKKWYILGHATGSYWEVRALTEEKVALLRQKENWRISSPFDDYSKCLDATLEPESRRFK